ncbi:flavodoxin [Ectothiorhodospira shaposhnikovii]|uniref:flavodoxin n=1 Tax=Ectothiorhodospira shaposhnikovii TaxID=1054 RepID=UPI0019089584|nr:flavodoxin [Ectothiorhodospira shaposhnikovii]MBK1674794.1 flavodoxin [Ectothiorhodospira shaposhnikovii]
MTTAIYYGTTSGSTEKVAHLIRETLQERGQVDLFDIGTLEDARSMTRYDLLIWGAPTWGYGDLQDDWESFMTHLDDIDLSGRAVAIFGLGDQYTYGEVFVDAMRILHDKAIERGARIIGHWHDDQYDFEQSAALLQDGLFCGLAVDEDNQSDLTGIRVQRWCHQLTAP